MAKRVIALLLGCCVGLSLVTTARSQTYPSQPIKIVVPLAAGGIADIVARMVAQSLAADTKLPVTVENKTGGAGAVAAEAVATSPPDGYTLFLGYHGAIAILPYLTSKLGYDAAKDFAPVIQIATFPNVLVVHPDLPARSVAELVAYAKANPGRGTFASQGNGSSGHMAGEQFKQKAAVDVVHVPYRGAAPAVQDLVAGHVNFMFDTVTFELPLLKEGRTRALAVTSPTRLAALPDIPTMAEAGFPGIESSAWFGLFAPAKTPPEVIGWLNAHVRKTFAAPDVRDRLIAQGAILDLGTPDEFRDFAAVERSRWSKVIRDAGLKLD